MEINVWMQWFVRAVDFVSSLFASLNSQLSQSSGGASPNVPANAAASISTSGNATNHRLRIVRNPAMATVDALFGVLIFNDKQLGFTMERTAVAIPEGVYNARLEMSPHFGFQTPHIDVPQRTYIEAHPANYPLQLEGCVAVGSAIDGDALDNSRQAFDSMMAVLPQEFTVSIESLPSHNSPKA
jgi:hypothetical protein